MSVVPTVPTGNFSVVNTIVDPGGSNKLTVNADGSINEAYVAGTSFIGGLVNGGTQTPKTQAGGSIAANVVVSAVPARLCKIYVTTLGSAAMLIYDNATVATGTIIGYIAASQAAGSLIDFQMPCVNGITIASGSNQPAVLIFYG